MVVLFSGACPLAAGAALVSNAIEGRSDAYKYLRATQRCTASPVADTGAWCAASRSALALTVNLTFNLTFNLTLSLNQHPRPVQVRDLPGRVLPRDAYQRRVNLLHVHCAA